VTAPIGHVRNGNPVDETFWNNWVDLTNALNTSLADVNLRKASSRGIRTTNSTTTTTEVGVLRLDGITVTLGRLYLIETSTLVLSSTVANDVLRCPLRASTAGAAGTGSTQVGMAQATMPNTTNPGPGLVARCLYVPGATGTLSVLLSVARQQGTGNVSILAASTFPIQLWVHDMGPDPGDTGVSI
jgi:hypothetical protein